MVQSGRLWQNAVIWVLCAGDVNNSRPGGPWLMLVACGVCGVASVAAVGAAAVASAAVVAALAAAMWCGKGGRDA